MPATLYQHVRQHHGEELATLLQAVAHAAKSIEAKLRIAGLSGVLGSAGSSNVQGEQQQKLDVFANEQMVEVMRALSSVAAVVSEEDDDPIVFEDHPQARYVAIFDPLDGSSNIDVNVNVGTIVSIQTMEAGADPFAAALQPGDRQVAALYVNYGPSTLLVYTARKGVHCFTLSGDEFVLSAEHLRMPADGSYYSLNEGNLDDSDPVYGRVVRGLRDGSLTGKRHGSRYVGSFIADFHRTLLRGGVFLYPPTQKNPEGKLRLLYEANPLSLIAEEAGGAATNGGQRIVAITPMTPHVRTSLIIGSSAEVAAASRLISEGPAE